MSIDENIWKLMSRAVFGEATDEEIRQLQDMLRQDSSLQQQYDIIHQLFEKRSNSTDLPVINYELQALRLLSKAEEMEAQAISIERIQKTKKIKYWIVAASIICTMGIAALLLNNKAEVNSPVGKLAVVAKDGERKAVVLQDGTKVWLNAGSKLFYLTSFASKSREMKLEGEAFFDVAKHQSKPFIVHAGDVRVKVLGTAFNIKAYQEDQSVTTSLYRGLVSVSRVGEEEHLQPIQLYPYQKLIVPNKTKLEAQQSDLTGGSPSAAKVEFLDSTKQESERIETSWIYNRLEFRGDDFISLAHKMQHWYDIKIHFEDEQVQRLSFNGSFEKETIEQALKALQIANPFTYKIQNNEVFIYSR